MRTNIYIRKEDEQRWAGIEDKPQFIHNAITHAADQIKVIRNSYDVTEALLKKDPTIKVCQHSYAIGLCKYGCVK